MGSDSTSKARKVVLRPLDPPRMLDRYELVAPIGAGGMATIYLARARGAGGFTRTVAVKVCHAHLRDNPNFVAMFLDEARLAARIHHPNVVSTLDVRDEEELFLVMEYVEGGHLAQIMRRHRAEGSMLSVPMIMRIVRDTLEGLHAAHELTGDDGQPLNLIHRDVSPQNILVGIDGISRIADFGVAKAEERAVATEPGEIKGKYAYMAPEQVQGRELTRRVDIFSASIVLWEALTNKRLFAGKSGADSIVSVLRGTRQRPSQLRPGLSSSLDGVVMKGLERDPSRRYATAREMAEAMELADEEMAPISEVGGLVGSLLADQIDLRRSFMSQTRSKYIEVLTTHAHTASDAATTNVDGPASASMVRARPRRRPWAWLAALGVAALVVTGLFLGIGGGQRATEERHRDDSTSRGGIVPTEGNPATFADAAALPPQDVADADSDSAATSADDSSVESDTARLETEKMQRTRIKQRPRPTKHQGKRSTGEYQPEAI